jgi:pSer/pThr/pTyr-binding forkhead associated (FHA) protein
MKRKPSLNIDLMEGRSYILGREGHIYIDSPLVSRHHAELIIIKRKIYLRDLNSTNGTYLVKDNRLVPFVRGFVSPIQTIVIGDQKRTILDLLAIASEFVSKDDAITQLDFENLGNSSATSGR